jgi:hypothetical protein
LEETFNESAFNVLEFHASEGWFSRFSNRVKLHDIRLLENLLMPKQAALEVVKMLLKLIKRVLILAIYLTSITVTQAQFDKSVKNSQTLHVGNS